MTLPALNQNQDNYLFVTSSVASLGTFRQFETSNILFTLDYRDYLAPGETLTNVAFSVSPSDTPPLAVSGSNIVTLYGEAAQGVSFTLGGGNEGTVYTVTVTATTTLPQTKVDVFKVSVTPESSSVGYPIQGGQAAAVGAVVGVTLEGTPNASMTRIAVGTGIVTLATRRSGRRAVTIMNTKDTNITLSQLPSFLITDGTPLTPGSSVTIETQAAIYGLSDAPDGEVSVVETF